MSDFKIGDKVRFVRQDPDGTIRLGAEGVVTGMHEWLPWPLVFFPRDVHGPYCDFFVHPSALEAVA